VRTDLAEHAAFGGVVPEVAARAHAVILDRVIGEALSRASVSPGDLDAIAAAAGPGLIGGVMVGLTTAKAMALAHKLHLIPINHLEGHALSARMTERVDFPFLLLLVSGGHTQLVLVDGVGRYRRLGTTIDDAAGEAFDKSAKLLGLGQPGGPCIEAAARNGRADRFRFPAPLAGRAGSDFSLSGMKTALRLAAEDLAAPTKRDVADLAASFQSAVARHLAGQTGKALERLADEGVAVGSLVAAGGVAANGAIRAELSAIASDRGLALVVPPAKYCTDNGAMIAWAGAERLASGKTVSREEALAFAPRPRWPLADPIVGAEFGGGRKGPKA
jgi:N6-L-threonylcarbamoyladenine synthase